MVMKRGDSPCTVFEGFHPSPVNVALEAAKTKMDIPLEDQTRSDYVEIKSEDVPNIEGNFFQLVNIH